MAVAPTNDSDRDRKDLSERAGERTKEQLRCRAHRRGLAADATKPGEPASVEATDERVEKEVGVLHRECV